MSKIDIAEAKRLYGLGAFLTDFEAAHYFGVCPSTICEFRKKHGVGIDKSTKAHLIARMDKKFGPGTYKFLLAMKAKGATFQEIAQGMFSSKKDRQKAWQWWKKIEGTK